MKIICIGRNYVNHIKELNSERPTEPVIFMKPDSAVLAEQTPFILPDFSNNVHHEIEIIVKINKVGKHIEEKFAHKYYDEISVGLDLTARDLQQEFISKGLPWEKAKAFDGSAIIGKFIPKSEFSSLENLNFELKINNNSVQRGNSSLMLWKIDEIISHISKYFTLKTGDIVFTGTPEGVGAVKQGDVLEGFLENRKLITTEIK